ncbi:NAD(P)H-flavin reductase [Legionella sp. km772]|uniref:NAD(P)H-flavin reductase n=1 Tax=Legionella sp. km772 TaxID=2498111 RepID=UPI000F8DF924|nr:NAD(P)H-flavin reductase [Legionella sp. km772]RUR12575.1 NAD(P)H-flavin reductase [Legionella sp. km772]
MMQQVVEAQVEKIVPLTDSIMHLILKPNFYVDYQAGQYLNILCEEQEFSYSIANAPLGAQHYELHIRHSLDNPYNQSLFAYIKKHGCVSLKLPYGNCSLDKMDPKRPILFIAGGTGFAPVNAMIEQLLADADPRSFELFWGARSQSDVYLDEKVLNWQAHISRFKYYSFLSEASKENLLSNLLIRHAQDLKEWQIVLSGPFEMVYSLRDVLAEQGVPKEQLFSDAFDFEK